MSRLSSFWSLILYNKLYIHTVYIAWVRIIYLFIHMEYFEEISACIHYIRKDTHFVYNTLGKEVHKGGFKNTELQNYRLNSNPGEKNNSFAFNRSLTFTYK